MSLYSRYFHCSQDINSDAEVWDMTRQHGDRSFRVWIEILAIGDRSKGALPAMSDSLARVLSGKCQVTASTVRHVWHHAQTCLWIVSDPSPRIANWAKYNRTQKQKSDTFRPSPTPTPTPTPLKTLKKESYSPKLPETGNSGNHTWPAEDLWLKEFLENQKFVEVEAKMLLDLKWWNSVAVVINGLDLETMEKEFAKMSTWLDENPRRHPMNKSDSWKRFVRNWLQNSAERERRNLSYGQRKRG